MCKCSVDRIEGEFAVLETESGFVQISTEALPDGVKEGDVLIKLKDGTYSIDIAETEEIKAKLFELQNSLFDN